MKNKIDGEKLFYRKLLEQITQDPRKTRARRLAESGLTFWDAMKKQAVKKSPTLMITLALALAACGCGPSVHQQIADANFELGVNCAYLAYTRHATNCQTIPNSDFQKLARQAREEVRP